ncbi:MAG: hypothetical protein PHO63_06585 [Bacilli bacterium]|nr:hypothetical protein [Bacilli bacterium]
MKKHNLFKAIGIIFLIFIVLSWIIPVGSFDSGSFVKGKINPIGLLDVVYFPILTITTFIQYGVLLLVIGGFYGVVNKTGVYVNVVDYLVKKVKGKEKQFLIIIISLLSLLSSLSGLVWPLFILVPFLMTVIISLGYGKLTALASTVGAILVGLVGTTYGINSGYSNYFYNLGIHTDIIAKFAILVIATFLLIVFVLAKAKKENTKKTETKTENVKVEKPLYDGKATNKKSVMPLVIVCGLTFIILLIGAYNWYLMFNVSYFTELYNNISAVTIKDIPIITNILGYTTVPFGYWGTYEMVSVLVVAALLLGWVYSIKFDEIVSAFGEGAKKVIKAAFYVVLANIIFAIMFNAQSGTIFTTMMNYILGLSEEVNVFVAGIGSAIGSFFYNDFYYMMSNAVKPVQAVWTDVGFYSVLSIVFQAVYGLMMLFIPTSMILIAGLSLSDISYKEWLKYIWKYLLQILAVVIIIALLLSMLV